MNALDIVGKRFSGVNANGYRREDVILGAPYLLTRDWTDGYVVIARQKGGHNSQIVVHEGTNWYATRVNPPVKVGDEVFALERATPENLRRDRKRKVTAVTDDGIVTQYGDAATILVTHWVLADADGTLPQRDRFNPNRRKIVLDRLSKEGMDRIGDTGYAISAKEFFDHFDLPRPEVQPTAFIDVEREMKWRDMDYRLRAVFENDNITSLRSASITGRAKVTLAKTTCRCKEVTEAEVMEQWNARTRWPTAKLHKVHCLWCMTPDKDGNLDVEDI